MTLKQAFEKATPRPWHQVHNGPKKRMTAVMGEYDTAKKKDHLICGSLICQVQPQDVIDHALIVHCVNNFQRLVDELDKAQLSLDVVAEDVEEAGYPARALETESQAANIRALLSEVRKVKE